MSKRFQTWTNSGEVIAVLAWEDKKVGGQQWSWAEGRTDHQVRYGLTIRLEKISRAAVSTTAYWRGLSYTWPEDVLANTVDRLFNRDSKSDLLRAGSIEDVGFKLCA